MGLEPMIIPAWKAGAMATMRISLKTFLLVLVYFSKHNSNLLSLWLDLSLLRVVILLLSKTHYQLIFEVSQLQYADVSSLSLERLAGIEPAFSGWRPVFLPLEDNRL
jgi:hypothetical protein